MTETDQRILIHALAQKWKETARELMVYQLFAQLLKENAPEVENLLETARNLPELQTAFDKSFEGLEEMLPQLLGSALNEEIRQLLERWNPTGRPN